MEFKAAIDELTTESMLGSVAAMSAFGWKDERTLFFAMVFESEEKLKVYVDGQREKYMAKIGALLEGRTHPSLA